MEIEINKVYNMDCIELMREMEMQGIKVDCVITDPPYLIDYKTGMRNDKNHKFCKTILNDNNPDLIAEYIRLCYSIMKDNTPIYCFCNADKIDFFKSQFEKNGFTIKNIIIWVKTAIQWETCKHNTANSMK